MATKKKATSAAKKATSAAKKATSAAKKATSAAKAKKKVLRTIKKETNSRYLRIDILADEYDTSVKKGLIETTKEFLIHQSFYSLKTSKIINKKKYYLLHNIWETQGEFFDKYVILMEI